MRTINLVPPRDDSTAALQRWTATRRALEHDQGQKALLTELRRLRGEVIALRLALERRAA